MNVRSLGATRRRASGVGIAVMAVAFTIADGLQSAALNTGELSTSMWGKAPTRRAA